MKLAHRTLCFAAFTLLASCGTFLPPGIPGGSSVDEARAIYDALLQRYHFPELPPPAAGHGEQGDEKGRQVYLRPLGGRSDILIYGIRSRKEQDRIIAILDDIRRTQRSHPVEVTFYANDRENDGADKPIRRVLIRASNMRELSPS